MKKVALIAYGLNPMLGSEAGEANLWLKIISKRYLVEVFTDVVHENDITKEIYQNVKFHFINTNTVLRKYLEKIGAYNILYVFFIRKVKKEINILNIRDLELIHCLIPMGIYAYNNLYTLGVPVLIGPVGGGIPTPKGFKQVFRNEYFRYHIRDNFYKCITKTKKWRKYFLKANKILVIIDSVKQMLPKEVVEKCVTMFDVVVNTEYYYPIEKRDNKQIKILFAGRLINTKGAILLIEAANLCVKKGFNNFIIEFTKGGPLRNKIITLIRKYNLGGRVIFLGHISKMELLKKYQQSDIFCLPTLREAGGNAILEAMACGLPVITSNYGGPSYSVTDECGIKINLTYYQSYVEDLSKALIYLIENKEARLQMGKKSRERAEQEFSPSALEKKIFSIYQEMVG